MAICKLFRGLGIAFAIAGLIAYQADILNLAFWSLLAYLVLWMARRLFNQLAILLVPVLAIGITLLMLVSVLQQRDNPATLFVGSAVSFMIYGLGISRPSRPSST